MRKIINSPENFVDEVIDGILLAHGDKLRAADPNRRAIVRTDAGTGGKVGIVTGGGSGHLPSSSATSGRASPRALPSAMSFPRPRQSRSMPQPWQVTTAPACSTSTATTAATYTRSTSRPTCVKATGFARAPYSGPTISSPRRPSAPKPAAASRVSSSPTKPRCRCRTRRQSRPGCRDRPTHMRPYTHNGRRPLPHNLAGRR